MYAELWVWISDYYSYDADKKNTRECVKFSQIKSTTL